MDELTELTRDIDAGLSCRMYSMFFSMHSEEASMRFSSRAKLRILRQLSTLSRRVKYWAHTWTMFSMDKWYASV